MELWTFQALPMACLTGLRREDVISLLWSRVSDIAIEKPTLKSKGRKVAVVPLLKDTVGLLTEIKAQQISRHRQLVENAKRKVGRRPPPASRYSRTPADARGPSMGRSTR
jgi:integrase